MDEYEYDWSQASTLDFLNYRSLTAPAGNPRLTYVMPASEWVRPINPQMNRTLVDTGYAEKFLFDRLSNIDRLKIALSAAIKCFPAAVQGDLMILLSASYLAKIAATLMGFIALSAIGAGQIIAMGVAAYAWWVAGNAAFDYIKAVATFARAVLGAKSEVELMQAGTKFGKATAHLSVDVIVAILTKKASVKMRESAGKIHEFAKEKKLLFGKYDVNSAQRNLPKETKKPSGNANFHSLEDIFKNGRRAKASELKIYAESKGWKLQKSQDGPIKYIDENGVVRITIKRGSPRTPGSEQPHVELRSSEGVRIDPLGNPVNRKSLGNHTEIDYDI